MTLGGNGHIRIEIESGPGLLGLMLWLARLIQQQVSVQHWCILAAPGVTTLLDHGPEGWETAAKGARGFVDDGLDREGSTVGARSLRRLLPPVWNRIWFGLGWFEGPSVTSARVRICCRMPLQEHLVIW